jgi:hypothetical protein
MLKISPITVILSFVALLGFVLVAIRENGIAVGLAIIATSIFLTCFLLYFTEQYLSLLLK